MSSHALGFGDGFTVNAYTNIPAITRQAVKSFSQLAQAAAQAYLESTQSEEKWLTVHDELHKRFKEQYKTWEECCQAVYKCTRQSIWERKQRAIERLAIADDHKLSLNNSEVGSSVQPDGKVKQQSDKADEKALKQVEKAREEKPATEKAKAEPKPVTDKTGYPVPASLVPVWERRTEIQVLLDELSHVKVQLEEYMKKGDEPMWTHQSLTTLIPDLQNVWRQVKAAMPFAVCSSCRGTKRDSCRHCRGWGFLPEFMWHMVPEEQKARV